nr:unnamed protein product [uncultured bacterium]
MKGSKQLLKRPLALRGFAETSKFKVDWRRQHPYEFGPSGLLVFCGPQGSGKTLSAVQYCKAVLKEYPRCKFVTNVAIEGLPPEVEVIPYNGLDSLSHVENGEFGVMYLIDEIHLEFNSLESKNISIEEMIEFSQQRKQRKHIVGTSQVFMRLAKPLREQIKDVVICKCLFGMVQHNILINGQTSHEQGGELIADVIKHYWFFHRPEMYTCYDTYAKMTRYKKEWMGRERKAASVPLYEPGGGVDTVRYRRGPGGRRDSGGGGSAQ